MFSWSDKVGRREFIGTGVSAVAAIAAGGGRAFAGETAGGTIQTVLGAVPAAELGFALPHEHVMCDFVGAGETGRHRWEVDAVVARMKPVLAELKARGVKTFFDCTPAYIGRDPRVLRHLAEATGLHIVTNTGYYGGPWGSCGRMCRWWLRSGFSTAIQPEK